MTFIGRSRLFSRRRLTTMATLAVSALALTVMQPTGTAGAVRSAQLAAPRLGPVALTVPTANWEISDATIGQDGNLWAVGSIPNDQGRSRRVWRIKQDGVITQFNTDMCAASPSITAGADGNLWFICSKDKVAKVTTAGEVTAIDAPVGDSPYWSMIATGSDGNLWIVPGSYGAPIVTRLTPAGVSTTFPVRGASNPTGAVKGPDGNLWTSNIGNNSLSRISPTGQIANITAGRSLSQPISIETGGDGNLWVANRDNSITRITPLGIATNFVGGSVNSPTSLTHGPDGNVWFWNSGNSSIGRITPSGAITNYFDENVGYGDILAITPNGFMWLRTSAGLVKVALAIPSAPRSVAATSSGSAATVSWSSPNSTGGFPVTGYTVTATPGGASCRSATTSCVVTGLTNGTTYTFKVRASTDNGAGLLSTGAVATPRPPNVTRVR